MKTKPHFQDETTSAGTERLLENNYLTRS